MQELCDWIPALNNELDRERGQGKTTEGKDYVRYVFKNGAYFDIVAASEKSRGKRRHAGLIEECVGVDGKILQEVIIPTMNVSRKCLDGTVQDDEVLNKAQIYITTAGWKNSFAYDKLIQLLVWMITQPEKAFVMGGTWRIPVLVGLLNRNFLQDLRDDGTFNESSFGREYESKWAGSADDAFFNGEVFDRNRKIRKPEYKFSEKSSKQAYYVIGLDVGRKGQSLCPCKISLIAGNSQFETISS